MRQLSKRVSCVDVQKVWKYLVTRVEHGSGSISLIIILNYILLRFANRKSSLF